MSALAPSLRRDLYALSARLLAREVDAPLYRQLASDEMAQLLGGSGMVFVDPELRTAPEAKALEELAVEYCRLFIGPIPECTPFESTNREDALLGGKARRRLDEFMEKHGLSVSEDAGLASPDHVAVHLSLLSTLAGVTSSEELDAAERIAASQAAHELLEKHVLPWAPRYFEHLEHSARCEPYRSIAALTAALLAEDRESHGL